MLKIWGRLSSINVQKVVWCAVDLGCEFERVDAGGTFGVVESDAFHRLNPNRKVPVIEDDGFVLWESNAIVRYLCAKYPDAGLQPESLIGLAECDRWMDWQTVEFAPALRDAFMQLVRTPAAQRDAGLVEQSIRQSEPMLAILEDLLAARPFIAGDELTMADIPIACTVHRWYGLPIERIERPNVDKWYERVGKRPGACAVLTTPLT